MILRVGILKRADGGDAHAVQVGAGFGGVALKIAMQRSLLLRNGQLVAGLGEMVHADVEVACFDKLHQARAKYFEFLHAFGQMRGERALLFFEPGHMGVAEQRDAIGLQLEDLIDGVAEAFRRLVRQTINEIDVDAIELQVARGEQQIARQFERLNSVNGRLHLGMKILDAHAEAVEAQATQSFEMLAGGYPRIDLDPDFRVRRKIKMLRA